MSRSPDARLLDAVLKGDSAAVSEFLAAGADPLRMTGNGVTAFDMALRLGFIDCTTVMLHAGVSPDVQDIPGHSCPPLYYAVVHDVRDMRFERVALLLSYGADPDVRFTYHGKPDATLDDVLRDKETSARPAESVTIGDLREMLTARRREIAHQADIERRNEALARGAVKSRKFKI